jgi:hypothetical protein
MLGLFFDVVGMLSYLLVVLGIVSGFVVAVVLGVRLVLRRKVTAAPLLYPGTAMIAGAAGLFAGYVSGPAPVPPDSMRPSAQLAYMHRVDQGDRFTLRFLNTARDDQRLARTRKLLEAGQVSSPEDQLNAAMVFQHGDDSSDYRTAYELASAACSTGVDSKAWPKQLADWLRRAAYDRWMLSIGQEQKYGTQRTIEF